MFEYKAGRTSSVPPWVQTVLSLHARCRNTAGPSLLSLQGCRVLVAHSVGFHMGVLLSELLRWVGWGAGPGTGLSAGGVVWGERGTTADITVGVRGIEGGHFSCSQRVRGASWTRAAVAVGEAAVRIGRWACA